MVVLFLSIMASLENIAGSGYESLVRVNEDSRIFNVRFKGLSVDLTMLFKNLPATIIDKQTLLLIQIADLHHAVDHTSTVTGSATLFRSLMQPPTSLDLVLAKQDSVKELEGDDKIRNAIADYLGEFQKGEGDLVKFLNGMFMPVSPYPEFKRAMLAGKNIVKAAKAIPTPESGYARYLVAQIRDFENSPVYRLMRGPIYRTFNGLMSKEDIGFFTPYWKFRPTIFTIPVMSGPTLLLGLIAGTASGLIERGAHLEPYLMPIMMVGMGGGLYGAMAKGTFDLSTAIMPLRKKAVHDKGFVVAVDSVGKLDELMSFIAYAKAIPHATTLPTVTDEDVHYFIAENMRNPIQAKGNPNYVPNAVNLNGARLTFVTGPNSGGKTTYCKSVFQNQVLGQVGGYVVASKARMNMADRMAYQAPQFDALQDEEGRFGTELKRTRDIFYATSPKSLVILDELAEGTTIEEKMQQSRMVLNGFYTIGNNTILVTHNHALVDNFTEEKKGQYLQVEFDGKIPTHRLIEGISRESHADRVAEKIGFSGKDIQSHLAERGYSKPSPSR